MNEKVLGLLAEARENVSELVVLGESIVLTEDGQACRGDDGLALLGTEGRHVPRRLAARLGLVVGSDGRAYLPPATRAPREAPVTKHEPVPPSTKHVDGPPATKAPLGPPTARRGA